MRFLGIDYGSKRIGLAVSDEEMKLAFPKETILNDDSVLPKISQVVASEDIAEIVVGESADFSGKPNPIQEGAEEFILELKEKFNLPVHKEKEFLTSVEARRYQQGQVDASAAALILQRYLDRRSRQKEG